MSVLYISLVVSAVMFVFCPMVLFVSVVVANVVVPVLTAASTTCTDEQVWGDNKRETTFYFSIL